MESDALFELPEGRPAGSRAQPPRIGRKRIRYAQREQVKFQSCSLDELLPDDDPARLVWEYVCGLDLSELYQSIQAVETGPGQAPADPRILLALWLYATLKGVGAARELDRLCERHVAYRWLCGEVSMNYHSLADFRVAHGALLNRLLTQSVAALLAEGLVTLERVAQDGMKVRASAGAASFRRQATLEEALGEAELQVATLRAELEADPAAATARQQAARQRAAHERAQRIGAALAQLPQIAAAKKATDRDKARASTTDPEARVMKMGDGGFRPAFNVQLATATDSQIITGVEVTNSGGDQGQLLPMVQQHAERYDQVPDEMLADGGFVKKHDIDQLTPPQGGTTVYAPVMKAHDPNRDPYTPRDDDSPAVAPWRRRMATPQAQEIYKQRAATAECVNALARNRGLRQFVVRGLPKVKAVVLWYVLAHNLMRAVTLRAAARLAAG
ncbi:MAG: IS1182 family transposase [Methylocella sp.]